MTPDEVRGALKRAIEKAGGVSRKPADLESILGPTPAQPSMSAFRLPTADDTVQDAPAGPLAVPAAPQAPPPASEPQRDALSREIEADIMEFCDKHPDEKFCGKLGLWLRQHPDPPR